MPHHTIPLKQRHTLLKWIQEECGHECEVWSELLDSGQWELHIRAGCAFCESFVVKTVHELYPQVPLRQFK
jgi:hypothetical protein